jgi:hypothetical protein
MSLDATAERYLELQRKADEANRDLATLRKSLIEEVLEEGSTPARATKTKALLGERYELRVSQPLEISVDTRVALRIRSACAASPRLFTRLFRKVESFVLADGTQKLINAAKLPARAPRTLRSLFARAIQVRELPPALEIRARKERRGEERTVPVCRTCRGER